VKSTSTSISWLPTLSSRKEDPWRKVLTRWIRIFTISASYCCLFFAHRRKKGSVLVFDLGEISVKSKPRVRERLDKNEQAKKTKEEIRQEVIDKSYDSFLITLNDFQVLLALPGDNFRAAIQKSSAGSKAVTGMELIKSKQFVVQLDQCLVQDDPQLPKLKLSATLPLLDWVITENRFMELLKLLVTLPFPQSAPPTGVVMDVSVVNLISLVCPLPVQSNKIHCGSWFLFPAVARCRIGGVSSSYKDCLHWNAKERCRLNRSIYRGSSHFYSFRYGELNCSTLGAEFKLNCVLMYFFSDSLPDQPNCFQEQVRDLPIGWIRDEKSAE